MNTQHMYFVVLAIGLVMLAMYVNNFQTKTPIAKAATMLLSGGVFTITTYMITMSDKNIIILSMHSITYTMTAMYFLIYTIRLDSEFLCLSLNSHKKVLSISVTMAIVDIFILTTGACFEKYSLYYRWSPQHTVVETPLASLHHATLLLLFIFGCIVLIQKRELLPSFYKEPYNMILAGAAYIIATEALCYMQNYESINLSMIGLFMEGMLMLRYSTNHRLDSLIKRSNGAVIDMLNDGFILLDRDKKIIYKNRSANQILPTDYEWDTVFELFRDNIENDKVFKNKIYLLKSKDRVEANSKFLDITYQTITDAENKYAGSYFLLHDATESEKSRRQSDFDAKHHPLTELYNKNEFCCKAKKYALLHRDETLLLIFFDIDKFKMINELFGLVAGDTILCTIANALREYIKDDGIYGHIGDDKFCILMRKRLYSEYDFFKAMYKNLFIEQDVDYKIMIHAGICEIDAEDYDESDMNITSFIDRAILALVDIKGDMHTRTATYGPHITKTILHQQKIINDVDKALDNKNICFFVQPQVNKDGESFGGEALVRWVTDKGIISPGEFIPILEDKGLISKVDLYVWDLVCQKLKEWKDKGYGNYYLSVNISAKDMYYMNIYDEFTALVTKYNIAPESLKLEVTESAVMLDKGRQFELLNRLRKYGFTIEIDDFGSGYSSLNMLKDIEFDMLKIDMAFLRETPHVKKSQEIIKSVIQMAKSIGTDVITEGVETEEQRQFLIDVGCENFQGYYFDRPLPVQQFEEKYMKMTDESKEAK